MKNQTVKKQIENLKKKILHHDRLYYELDKKEITDQEYDKLFEKLIKLEEKHPSLKTKDSPTNKVPGKALDKFNKVKRKTPMLSLQNSYSKEEIEDFYNRLIKLLDLKKVDLFLEPKLDGVAIELIYEKGELKKALTRGDGTTGEEVTENIKTLRGLPLFVEGLKGFTKISLRGEVVMLKQDFQNLNKEREEVGLETYASARNLASGSLRQLDPKVTKKRALRFFTHSLGEIQGKKIPFSSQSELFQFVKKIGIPVLNVSSSIKLPKNLCFKASSFKKVASYYDKILSLKDKLPFELDGIVIKVNEFDLQKQLGSIARSPRWAIAGKFPAVGDTTLVKDIVMQVGRTGVITPLALLKTVTISGVRISSASLHNFKDLERKDVRVGDLVFVERAGDVIPEVVRVVKEKRKKGLKSFKAPKSCPSCKSKLSYHGDYLICGNTDCKDKKEAGLIHFCSKRAMNIEFLGEKSIKRFLKLKWLDSFSDIYLLKDKDIKNLEGFGEKSFDLLVRNIEKSKKVNLGRLLFAIGIPLIGEQTAEKISEEVFQNFLDNKGKVWDLKSALQEITNLKEEDLIDIEDVGPLVAQSFVLAFKDKRLKKTWLELHKLGLQFEKREKKKSNKLKGLQFVITGTFDIPRDQIKKQIESHGGKVSSQVSSKTSKLLVGEKPGSKKEKALKLKIPQISMQEFLRLL